MNKKRIGLTEINHLRDRLSWTMGVAGVIRMLVWETGSVLGISKTKFRDKITETVYKLSKSENISKDQIKSTLKKEIDNEIMSSKAESIYDSPKTDLLISPIEAQRRLRYFSEEFLNKEFDILLSLLPNKYLNNYFLNYFDIPKTNDWNIIGSSNDYEQATGIKFMYMDTLAYSHISKTLIALELKMDSQLGKDQLLKYMFMAAYLEEKEMISPNTEFKILILSPDSKTHNKIPELLEKTKEQINQKEFPKKGVTLQEMEALTPNVLRILKNVDIKSTTWQEFGEYFQVILDNIDSSEYSETFYKLVNGFLTTLKTKYSRKLKKNIYIK